MLIQSHKIFCLMLSVPIIANALYGLNDAFTLGRVSNTIMSDQTVIIFMIGWQSVY